MNRRRCPPTLSQIAGLSRLPAKESQTRRYSRRLPATDGGSVRTRTEMVQVCNPAALPFELRNHGGPAGIPAGALHRVERAAAYGLRLVEQGEGRNEKHCVEGGAGFEPTASCRAAGVLPEAPSAHVAGLSRLSAGSRACKFIPQGLHLLGCLRRGWGAVLPYGPEGVTWSRFPGSYSVVRARTRHGAIVGEAGIEPAF